MPEDWEYVRQVSKLFATHGAEVYYVELEASLPERLRRNRTPNRLEHKATKRVVRRIKAHFQWLVA